MSPMPGRRRCLLPANIPTINSMTHIRLSVHNVKVSYSLKECLITFLSGPLCMFKIFSLYFVVWLLGIIRCGVPFKTSVAKSDLGFCTLDALFLKRRA